MELALISDSHIPERETAIPVSFRELIGGADQTIHAGDFATVNALESVLELATEVTAVHGNADPVDIGLPAVADVAIGDVTFVVTHGTVNPVEAGVYGTDGVVFREEAWLDAIADTARVRSRSWDGQGIVGVGGHTHDVVDTVHDGVRVLNPGSVTGADPADAATMMLATVEDGSVDVSVHEA